MGDAIGKVSTALATLALAGCMNITFTQAVKDPGPHDSPITVITLGALGDAALAAGAAAAHAAADEDVAFQDAFVYYALPLLAIDLIVTVIRIDRYR